MEFCVGDIRVELLDQPHDRFLHLACKAMTERDPPRKALEAFTALAAQGGPIGEPIRRPSMSEMPTSFQEFSARLRAELHGTLDRVIGLLRWRGGGDGPVFPDAGWVPYKWSIDGESWHRFPGDISVVLNEYLHLDVQPEAEHDLQDLVANDLGEPFPYELLREASALQTSNPRSSLMISIAALEVAVKQYIADRVPEADWLVNEMQAPDVVKMLSGYLPALAPPPAALDGASTLEPLSDGLLELLRKRRDQRNELAHRPEAHQAHRARVATPERAMDAAVAVQQVLLRLDVANGHLWARQYLKEPPYSPRPTGVRYIGPAPA